MVTKMSGKKKMVYNCDICDYNTYDKKDFEKHKLTKKHILRINGDKMVKNGDKLSEKSEFFGCECGKEYKYKQGLSRHKKSCVYIIKENKEEIKDMVYKLIIENNDMKTVLLKENQELKREIEEKNKQITELIPKVGSNNNNRNKFNINIFLNEKCKDALSMDQFIDKIEVSIKDLITTRDKGQPEGISNIIIENMKKLSLYERPVHCTDKKRETLYIKTDEWEKDEDKELINDALKKIESKQLKNVKKWMEKHPNYMNNQKEQEEFLKLINETTKSDERNREKVIKNICNTTYLDK